MTDEHNYAYACRHHKVCEHCTSIAGVLYWLQGVEHYSVYLIACTCISSRYSCVRSKLLRLEAAVMYLSVRLGHRF